MGETYSIASEAPTQQGTVEREPVQAQIILARGMEDLPPALSGIIAGSLGAKAFDSNWSTGENFQTKLERFKEMVLEAKRKGGRVIVIGVSAGAGLALSFMLENPGLVDHLYSCSGVLDPNLNEQKKELSHLTTASSSFREMCDNLTAKLHPNQKEFILPYSPDDPAEGQIAKAVKWQRLRGYDDKLVPELIRESGLANRITAYSSLGESDRTVPSWTRMPPWVKNFHYIGGRDHVAAIATTLLADLKKDLQKYSHKNFTPGA